MSNYLNQIESDLYKLYSITNGSGEVVEMVTELKEKYEKAKSWDKYKAHTESHIAGEINEEEFVSDLKSDYFESGESDA